MNFIKVHLPIIKNLMPTTINNNPNNLETKFWPNAIPKLAPKNDMIKIPIPIMDATLKSTSPFLKYLKTAKKLTGSSIEARDVPIDLLKGYFKINPSNGTIKIPPPIPNIPDDNPAIMPIKRPANIA